VVTYDKWEDRAFLVTNLELDLRNPLRLARELKPRKQMMEEMGAAYMANGLITLAGSRMYTSMADTNEVIDEALNRFEAVLSSA
jgi:glutamate-1-semialdehyde 2,1-aminomutase